MGYAIACMRFNTLEQAQYYLEQFVQPLGGNRSGEHNFARMKHFMHLLDDPQDKIKVIHIAGTSGKGSTAYILSSFLHAHGFKVGLTVSPHITDIRERTQVNNKMVSEKEYCMRLSSIIPAIETMKQSKYGSPSFFEITMAHAFYSFYHERVDYAVIETGLGGRYDASNVVTRADKLCIITRIGFDHMDFLGDTIAKIATEKAHIIQKGNKVLSAPQEDAARKAINRVAGNQGSSVTYVSILENVQTSLHGSYQKENISVAQAALYTISKRDRFSYDSQIVEKTRMTLAFAGRFDVRHIQDKTVILDGAHNPQKMASFTSSLVKEYPDQKFPFLIAFSKTKDARAMLDEIIPLAHKVIITTFGKGSQGMHIQYQDPENIKSELQKKGFNKVQIVPDTESAWKAFIAEKSSVGVVTGSLYLLSDIYSCVLNTQ